MARKDFYDIKGLGDELPEDDRVTQPARPYKRPKQRHGHPALIAVLVIVIIVVLAGGYLFLKHSKKSVIKQPSKLASVQATTSTANGTTQYVSNGSDLNLSFSYPSDWTVTPASGGNANDQTITVTSPFLRLPTAGGSSVTGKIVVTIRPGSASLSELNANTPTAALASTQFAYTTPTANQYQYPYLTYIHFSTGSAVAGAFEEVLVTGTNQFAQGQAVTAIALTGLDPIIGASFTACVTSACSGEGAKPLSITDQIWTTTEAFMQVQSLFDSLKLN